MKSLRRTGRRRRRARLVEIFRRALERWRVGQDGKARRAALLIGARERRRIEIGADQPFRWAGLLDLGDQAVALLRARLVERRQKTARSVRHAGALLRAATAARASLPPRLRRACRPRCRREWSCCGLRHCDQLIEFCFRIARDRWPSPPARHLPSDRLPCRRP